jgi:hypothetical protein
MNTKPGLHRQHGSRARLPIILGLVMTFALLLSACNALEVGFLEETPVLDPTSTVPPTAEVTPDAPTAEPTNEPVVEPTEPAATVGTLTGRVCYPSEFIPAMTAYFQNVGTSAITELAIAENQTTYSIELEPGTYTAYSWRTGYEVGQGASVLVDDGNGSQRAESLRELEVAAGATVTANLCDPLPLDVQPGNAPARPPSPGGLVYGSTSGIGIMDDAGQIQPLFDRSEAVLSPDGAQVLYVNDDDIWLADLASGTHSNLTNTPDRVEHAPQWWPARPDLVLFSSYERGREILMGPGIFPTLTGTDGTGYTVLFEDSDVYTIAPSPDGVTVAYGIGPVGWVHNVDTGERAEFDITQQGLDMSAQPRTPANWSIGNPAWDPTGTRRMTWTVGMFFEDGTNQISTGVFDLDAGTASLIHPYEMAGTDGYPPAAKWSPDGQWLAVPVWSLDPNEQGLWVWRADGSDERYLGQGGSPAWSPDGQYVAWTDALNSTIASRPQSTDLFVLPRPADHWLIDWRVAP